MEKRENWLYRRGKQPRGKGALLGRGKNWRRRERGMPGKSEHDRKEKNSGVQYKEVVEGTGKIVEKNRERKSIRVGKVWEFGGRSGESRRAWQERRRKWCGERGRVVSGCVGVVGEGVEVAE